MFIRISIVESAVMCWFSIFLFSWKTNLAEGWFHNYVCQSIKNKLHLFCIRSTCAVNIKSPKMKNQRKLWFRIVNEVHKMCQRTHQQLFVRRRPLDYGRMTRRYNRLFVFVAKRNWCSSIPIMLYMLLLVSSLGVHFHQIFDSITKTILKPNLTSHQCCLFASTIPYLKKNGKWSRKLSCHLYIYFVKLQSILKVLSNKFANLSRSKGRFNLNCQLLQTLWYIPH